LVDRKFSGRQWRFVKLLEQGDAAAALAGLDRAHHSRRARAKHHNVELVIAHSPSFAIIMGG
jgi:hypothetical protein